MKHSLDACQALELESLPESLFLLGDAESYATVQWSRDGGVPLPMVSGDEETLLAFQDCALASSAEASYSAFAGLQILKVDFDQAREIAKAEDLGALAIVLGPLNVVFHCVR